MSMVIVIPTRGRVGRNGTLNHLPVRWRKRTIVVCPKDEVSGHRSAHPDVRVIDQPASITNIAEKRAWIFRTCHKQGIKRIMMLDDDLSFALRIHQPAAFRGYGPHEKDAWKAYRAKNPQAHNLLKAEPDDPRLDEMFRKIDLMLDVFAHGGIAPRQMNQECPGEWEMNRRVMYSLAYDVEVVMKYCKLGRIGNREDLDYTLQLLRAGFENCVYTWGTVNHMPGFGGTAGGMEDERTVEKANADALLLAKLHPGLVTVVDREYNGSVHRKEVIIKWKQAIQQGRKK